MLEIKKSDKPAVNTIVRQGDSSRMLYAGYKQSLQIHLPPKSEYVSNCDGVSRSATAFNLRLDRFEVLEYRLAPPKTPKNKSQAVTTAEAVQEAYHKAQHTFDELRRDGSEHWDLDENDPVGVMCFSTGKKAYLLIPQPLPQDEKPGYGLITSC